MRRLKFLPVTLVLILSIFAFLTLGPNSNGLQPIGEEMVADLSSRNTSLTRKQIEQYGQRQRQLKEAVATYFEKAIGAGDIVGAGVSIVKGDSIVLSDGFGKRSYEGLEKIDAHTVFRLGSLSKGFTGVLAADLKQEGRIDWNDKVIEYIPEFHLGDAAHTGNVLLKHILSHTSGTPYHSFTNLVDAGIPVREIAKRFREVTPISEPGELYSYQNAMFALSAEIMEEATGKDISALLHDRFFKPLGMRTASTNAETLRQRQNVAMPHVKKRKGFKSTKLTNSYYNAIAAGGIDASALDMAKWMRFLLGHNPEVMGTAGLAKTFEPQIEINIGRKYYKRWPGHLKSHYAFGWRVHRFRDNVTQKEETVWHHGGSVNRYRNEIALYPESDLGICVLLNSNSGIAKTVIPDLHQIVGEVYRSSEESPSKTLRSVSTTFE